MNYRHIYHAGNFADVLKHAVLARLVTYLKGKDKAFRVIDTHAGIGVYDLSSPQAQRTGEWLSGIGALMDSTPTPEAAALLSPYMDCIRDLNPDGGVTLYPGSPKLARMLMRKQDRLSAIELHPDDSRVLQAAFDGDYQTRVIHLDGWLALGAHVPPKEKRGLVLVDPPFEQPGEFDRMVDGLARALRRWRGGTYCLWYPIKSDSPDKTFHQRICALDLPDVLAVEHWVRERTAPTGLSGSGMVIINPPYTLADELTVMLPALEQALNRDDRAGSRVWNLASYRAGRQQ
ncbi:23S rRNA (adenine(2030)-N(6))-methyltransferase RlmJ [Pararhizobium haloflavum]|uniref:23S rRNA (adenine(2030)-N(6))-methyltransferase RlmJ n=1 Tax=Pararhizobium haloflavum TaxID=2037914 RepID=UPI000C17640D|nr:23S rRNA (adenine(2030)-N(6))-methyltransferase RlmJ [Pararhizobium haloflavum]